MTLKALEHYLVLKKALDVTCDQLVKKISADVRSFEFVDHVSGRTKTADSFIKKASRMEAGGNLKYQNPFDEIQDFIGVRIIVFYQQTKTIIDDYIHDYYVEYEETIKEPLSYESFGYEGKHFILRIPKECLPDIAPAEMPECFELQVKTVHEHAWSQSSHDILYKSDIALSDEQRRRISFAAASAWGADQVFKQILDEIRPDYPSKE